MPCMQFFCYKRYQISKTGTQKRCIHHGSATTIISYIHMYACYFAAATKLLAATKIPKLPIFLNFLPIFVPHCTTVKRSLCASAVAHATGRHNVSSLLPAFFCTCNSILFLPTANNNHRNLSNCKPKIVSLLPFDGRNW